MDNFRDFLNRKNYFEHLQDSMDSIDEEVNKLKTRSIAEAPDKSLNDLTDIDAIDNEVDKAQDDADDTEDNKADSKSNSSDDDVNPEDKEPQGEKNKRIEKQSFNNLLKSEYLVKLTKACKSFKRISKNKSNGFVIPDDHSITIKLPKLVNCGYQVPFALFNASPVDGDWNNINKIHLLDDVSVANISTDYYGVNFFIRNDFVITDTNTDNYAEKLFNQIVNSLKPDKLTYDFLKTAALNKIKDDQTIDDDVIIGYMRMYNFASYVSKNIIEPYYRSNKLPIFVSDRENLDIGLIQDIANK